MTYIKGLPGQFLDMGKNVASGLVDGIKSGIDAAGDAIAGMAESVKNKFKGWLGIASPSKVFAGYGLNVAQGAALGIKAGEGEAAGRGRRTGEGRGKRMDSAAGTSGPAEAGCFPSGPDCGHGRGAGRAFPPGSMCKRLFAGLFPVPAFPGTAAGMARPETSEACRSPAVGLSAVGSRPNC